MSDAVWVIIPAGGKGLRAGLPVPKQFADMGGTSVLERTVNKMREIPQVEGVVVAVPPDGQEPHPQVVQVKRNLSAMRGEVPPVFLVDGGDTRQESVYRALEAVPRDAAWIAVHDAARPFVGLRMFGRVLEAAYEHGSAVCGMPPSDTIKVVGEAQSRERSAAWREVRSTLDRDSLAAVQTPQVFSASLYRRAHEAALRDGFTGTDDSSLVERLGVKVAVVTGERSNVKITYPEDFQACRMPVTGLGFDIHPRKEGRKCVIGGVEIPSEKGLSGHSDADVLCHAVMDAILGALGKGDIGQWFPDSDPKYYGASSLKMLSSMWDELRPLAGIVNLDAVVIAEAPRIMPHAQKIRENIAAAIGCLPEQVSVKATTAERLGSLGRGEGIAAFCVATLIRRF